MNDRLGLPYMGSKNKIAREIVALLPPAETFVDLFAGGCAVTHAAILSGKYRGFVANDISVQYPRLFQTAVRGELPPPRVYTREEFNACKDRDPIAALCWSFGNKSYRLTYLWGKEIERAKQTACRMILADTWQKRFEYYKQYVKIAGDFLRRPGVERLQSLQSLESLQRLHPDLVVTGEDYAAIAARYSGLDVCFYADPPYAGTACYHKSGFDHDRFYDWLRSVDFSVYVSEYTMPEDFTAIWERRKTCTLSSTNNARQTVEKVFVRSDFAGQAVKDAGMLDLWGDGE